MSGLWWVWEETNLKIAIAGGGVIGLSIAAEISTRYPQESVTVFAGLRPGATDAAGAMFNVFSEIDRNTLVFLPMFRKLEYAALALELWPDWAAKYGIPAHFCETLVHAQTDLDQEILNYIGVALKTFGDKFGAIDSGIAILQEGYVQPTRLKAALINAIHRNQNCIVRSTDFMRQQDDKSYDVVIWANGAYASMYFDFKVRTFYGNGLGMIFPGRFPPNIVRTPVRFNSCGINVLPYGADETYVGASNYISANSHVPKDVIRETCKYLAEQAEALTGARFISKGYRTVLGPRPMTEDGQPLVGWMDDRNFIVTGTRRDGLTISPRLAPDVADCVVKYKTFSNPIYDDWRPNRDPLRWLPKDIAVIQTTQSLIERAKLHNQDINLIDNEVLKKYNSNHIEYGVLPEYYEFI